MTLTRTLSIGLAALLFVACGGDPGSKIPDPAAVGAPPAATDAPSSPQAPGTAPTAGGVALTVTVEGTGRVVSQPAGIDCPGTCTAKLAPGTHVTLTATAAEGWQLSAWRGACSGGGDCSFVVSADSSVTGALSLIDARWDPAVGVADCTSAWGNGGDKLSPCDAVKDDYVVVHKSKRNVALCKAGKLVKNLRAGLGKNAVGDKNKEGDGKTPEGVFYVPSEIPSASFYKAIQISYPSDAAAQRGVSNGLISNAQRSQIQSAHAACVAPPQDTALGGDLELHGNGSNSDWTSGDIALEDKDVDLLSSSIGVGDSIVILP